MSPVTISMVDCFVLRANQANVAKTAEKTFTAKKATDPINFPLEK